MPSRFEGHFLKELRWFVDNEWVCVNDGEVIETEGGTLRAFHTPGQQYIDIKYGV